MTVSVLGLVVNIIGLSCFHDLHHHDGGDCGHSHGHEPEHQHTHSHDHEHSHSHSHDHSQTHENLHHSHDHTQHSHHSHNHKNGNNGHSHCHDTEHNAHSHSHEGHGHNENITGFFLHILADALGSVGVIISSLLIHYYGWYVADPICSFIISVLIFASVVPLTLSSGSTLLLMNPSEDLVAQSKSGLNYKNANQFNCLH